MSEAVCTISQSLVARCRRSWIFVGSSLRKMIALTLALNLLAACHSPFVPPVTRDTSFDQHDKWGLVVMGLACDSVVEQDIFFVHWYAYDKGKQSIIPPLDSKEPVGWLPGLKGTSHEPHYSVIRVPPGDYILGAATSVKNGTGWFHDQQFSYESRFFGSQANIDSLVPMVWSAEGRSTASSTAPRISVKAGEIVYVGDYFFSVDSQRKAKLVRISFDMDRAKAALKPFANVTGEMRRAEVSSK